MNQEHKIFLDDLRAWFSARGSALVAYSGGVDSTLLLKVATDALGAERALGVTSDSESLSREALQNARELAARHGFNHEVIHYSELAIPHYAENPANRCYFCKSELYTRLARLAAERGFGVVVEGSNADDQRDHQHGMQAAAENKVASPLQELGIGKSAVRELARELGLPNWNRPSAPCLSSRVPYGSRVTVDKLDQIAAGEQYLRERGFGQVRLRHYNDTARLELDADEMRRVFLEPGLRAQIVEQIKSLGFTYVTLDLQGFRSGALNEALGRKS